MNLVLGSTSKKVWAILSCFVFVNISVAGQSLTHPHIWVSASDRQNILDNIEKYDWAESLFTQLESGNISIKDGHQSNPLTLLNSIPAVPGNRDYHRELLNTGAECGIMYYLTGDEEYAQVAADIFHQYAIMIKHKNPATIEFYTPEKTSNHHIMTREVFPRVGIIYDFIYPFIAKPDTRVYDRTSHSRVEFDFEAAQKSFQVIAENVLTVGGMDSNHPVIELTGGLYSVLCMEDDAKRKSYFDRLWKGEPGQNGITWMFDHFTKKEGTWPESSQYSKLAHNVMLKTMNVLDRYVPEYAIFDENRNILDGAFLIENLKYPDGEIMTYGDEESMGSETDYFYRNVLAIAYRLGLASYELKATSILKELYNEKGGYKPVIQTQKLDWQNPLQLLWGVNTADSVNAGDMPIYSTIALTYAGVVMQRNGCNPKLWKT